MTPVFNPYLMSLGSVLQPVSASGSKDPMGAIFSRLRKLDSDDLILLLIIFLLVKDGDRDNLWPMVAALLYLIL